MLPAPRAAAAGSAYSDLYDAPMAATEAWRDAAHVRRLPLPTVPPPGTVDVAIGYLLARAAPFDRQVQAAFRRQHGWGLQPPAPIKDVRTSGRWQAIPALRRLTAATLPPPSLVAALDRLVQLAPCWSDEAAADLLHCGLLAAPIHPAGVLSLARLYGHPIPVELIRHGDRSALWPLGTREARQGALGELRLQASTAGFTRTDLNGLATQHGIPLRELTFALEVDERLGRYGDCIWRVNDESSSLARHVGRMLVTAQAGLPLDSLVAGFTITWRFDRRPIPTAEELGRWSGNQEWLTQGGERVRLAGPLSARRRRLVACHSDRILEVALRAAPDQTLKHSALVAALLDHGYKRSTAIYAIATAPILI
jgi:hypothetical protein